MFSYILSTSFDMYKILHAITFRVFLTSQVLKGLYFTMVCSERNATSGRNYLTETVKSGGHCIPCINMGIPDESQL